MSAGGTARFGLSREYVAETIDRAGAAPRVTHRPHGVTALVQGWTAGGADDASAAIAAKRIGADMRNGPDRGRVRERAHANVLSRAAIRPEMLVGQRKRSGNRSDSNRSGNGSERSDRN